MGNDNGILDLETINNELMEQRNINAKPESSELPNTAATMNSGTMSPLVSDSVAIEPVTMEAANPVMPDPVVMEATNPVMPDPVAMEAVSPVMPDFSDLEIQDNFQNPDQVTVPEFSDQTTATEPIDSRSFTRTPAEWKRIQEEEKRIQEERERIQEEGANHYVDFADAIDNYSERKPQNFFQVYFAFLFSIILAGVFVLINVKFYNIEYISTLHWLSSMLPPMGLFYGFHYMTGKRRMTVPVGILLIVLNEFISYFMFRAVMVHGVKEMYAELSYKEAWRFVSIMKEISEAKELYYTHFFSIFGVASLVGIVFGWYGMRGVLDPDVRRRRGYR